MLLRFSIFCAPQERRVAGMGVGLFLSRILAGVVGTRLIRFFFRCASRDEDLNYEGNVLR